MCACILETSCTPATCLVPQSLCPIIVGNTLEFKYLFKSEDGEVLNISGLTFTFWMKQDISSPIGEPNDLVDTIVFPTDAETAVGIGYQSIVPAKTVELLPNICYSYRFVATKATDQVYTMGLGTVQVVL